VVGLNVHPSHKLVVATTAGGVAHGVRYKDSALVKEFETQTAQELPGSQREFPSQRAVAFSPCGKLVAISQGCAIGTWKLSPGEGLISVQSFGGAPAQGDVHPDSVRDVAFDDSGDRLVSHSDAAVAVWDVKAGKILCKVAYPAFLQTRPFTAPNLPFAHLSIVPQATLDLAIPARERVKFRGAVFQRGDSDHLVCCTSHADGGRVSVRKVAEGLPAVRDSRVSANPLTAMGAAGAGFAVATAEGEVVVLSEATLRKQCILGLHAMPVTAVVPLPGGDTLSTGFDNFVCVSNARDTIKKQARASALMFALLLLLVLFVVLVLVHEPLRAILA
jgi:WD40 repeat protein